MTIQDGLEATCSLGDFFKSGQHFIQRIQTTNLTTSVIRSGRQKLKSAAKCCFIARKESSFDEGGIPSKSCYNPVRQYNNSKLDKYWIDFFILANESEGHNFIIHIDVYQGKSSENNFIPREIWDLLATQKAIVNLSWQQSWVMILTDIKNLTTDTVHQNCLWYWSWNIKYWLVVLLEQIKRDEISK